jgi:hypothetical protein
MENINVEKVTINKSDYSQVTGVVIKVSEQNITLNLTNGLRGVESNLWVTIKDENGKEHIGTI